MNNTQALQMANELIKGLSKLVKKANELTELVLDDCPDHLVKIAANEYSEIRAELKKEWKDL